MAGGIIFRLVTPNHPGEPTLDDPSLSIQFRKEYVCYDSPGWTTDRAKAHVYATYGAARTEAEAMGPRFHACVVSAADESVPERLRPLPEPSELPPVLAFPRAKKNNGVRLVRRPREAGRCQSWVNEVYG